MRTSLVRSSWSRERLSSTTAARRRWPSSSAGGRPRRPRARPRRGLAVRRPARPRGPGGMLEPVSLLTTGAAGAPSATASSRVVVVLPLVPGDQGDLPARRSGARAGRGRARRPSRPPATVPCPGRRRRDTALAAPRAARQGRPAARRAGRSRSRRSRSPRGRAAGQLLGGRLRGARGPRAGSRAVMAAMMAAVSRLASSSAEAATGWPTRP